MKTRRRDKSQKLVHLLDKENELVKNCQDKGLGLGVENGEEVTRKVQLV